MASKDDIGFIRNSKAPQSTSPFRRQMDFRHYLVVRGVTDFLTKFLNKLMIDRPENPIEVLQRNETKEYEIELLKKQLEEANSMIADLQLQNKLLKKKVQD